MKLCALKRARDVGPFALIFFLFFVVLPPTLFFFADRADDARCNSNLLWEMEEEQKRVYGV